MTAAEEKLWHHLRSDIVLQKTHFRRQVIFKDYIVDFCCHASRLIIEVDGATHSTDIEIQKDESRTRHLNAMGYRVVRFTNDDVFRDIGSVMDTIYTALEDTPHVLAETEKSQNRNKIRKHKTLIALLDTPTPYPSPQGGGEIKNDSEFVVSASSLLSPQGGGEIKNDSEFVVSTSSLPSPQGGGKTTSNKSYEHSSFPSPLEGEGQGGG